MADPVEEVRIAEGDVLRARRDLRAHVRQHDVDRDDAEAAVVDRHDRTVTAAVLAAAARLGVAGDPAVRADLQRGVARQGQHPLAPGVLKCQPRRCHRASRAEDGAPGDGATTARTSSASNSPSEDLVHAALAQQVGVERRVQTVGDRAARPGSARAPGRSREAPAAWRCASAERTPSVDALRTASCGSRSRDRSTQVTSIPASRSQAAGDARPNG